MLTDHPSGENSGRRPSTGSSSSLPPLPNAQKQVRLQEPQDDGGQKLAGIFGGTKKKRTDAFQALRARERTYDVNLVSHHMPSYDPLTDEFLKDYFTSPHIHRHLLKLGLIDREGHIVDQRRFKYNQIRQDRNEYEARLMRLAQEREFDREIETLQAALRRKLAASRDPLSQHKLLKTVGSAERKKEIIKNYPRTMTQTALLYSQKPPSAERQLMIRLKQHSPAKLRSLGINPSHVHGNRSANVSRKNAWGDDVDSHSSRPDNRSASASVARPPSRKQPSAQWDDKDEQWSQGSNDSVTRLFDIAKQEYRKGQFNDASTHLHRILQRVEQPKQAQPPRGLFASRDSSRAGSARPQTPRHRSMRPKSARPTRNSKFPVAGDSEFSGEDQEGWESDEGTEEVESTGSFVVLEGDQEEKAVLKEVLEQTNVDVSSDQHGGETGHEGGAEQQKQPENTPPKDDGRPQSAAYGSDFEPAEGESERQVTAAPDEYGADFEVSPATRDIGAAPPREDATSYGDDFEVSSKHDNGSSQKQLPDFAADVTSRSNLSASQHQLGKNKSASGSQQFDAYNNDFEADAVKPRAQSKQDITGSQQLKNSRIHSKQSVVGSRKQLEDYNDDFDADSNARSAQPEQDIDKPRQLAKSQQLLAASQQQLAKSQQSLAKSQQQLDKAIPKTQPEQGLASSHQQLDAYDEDFEADAKMQHEVAKSQQQLAGSQHDFAKLKSQVGSTRDIAGSKQQLNKAKSNAASKQELASSQQQLNKGKSSAASKQELASSQQQLNKGKSNAASKQELQLNKGKSNAASKQELASSQQQLSKAKSNAASKQELASSQQQLSKTKSAAASKQELAGSQQQLGKAEADSRQDASAYADDFEMGEREQAMQSPQEMKKSQSHLADTPGAIVTSHSELRAYEEGDAAADGSVEPKEVPLDKASSRSIVNVPLPGTPTRGRSMDELSGSRSLDPAARSTDNLMKSSSRSDSRSLANLGGAKAKSTNKLSMKNLANSVKNSFKNLTGSKSKLSNSKGGVNAEDDSADKEAADLGGETSDMGFVNPAEVPLPASRDELANDASKDEGATPDNQRPASSNLSGRSTTNLRSMSSLPASRTDLISQPPAGDIDPLPIQPSGSQRNLNSSRSKANLRGEGQQEATPDDTTSAPATDVPEPATRDAIMHETQVATHRHIAEPSDGDAAIPPPITIAMQKDSQEDPQRGGPQVEDELSATELKAHAADKPAGFQAELLHGTLIVDPSAVPLPKSMEELSGPRQDTQEQALPDDHNAPVGDASAIQNLGLDASQGQSEVLLSTDPSDVPLPASRDELRDVAKAPSTTSITAGSKVPGGAHMESTRVSASRGTLADEQRRDAKNPGDVEPTEVIPPATATDAAAPTVNAKEGERETNPSQNVPLPASRTDLSKSAASIHAGSDKQFKTTEIAPENVPLPASRADLAKSSASINAAQDTVPVQAFSPGSKANLAKSSASINATEAAPENVPLPAPGSKANLAKSSASINATEAAPENVPLPASRADLAKSSASINAAQDTVPVQAFSPGSKANLAKSSASINATGAAPETVPLPASRADLAETDEVHENNKAPLEDVPRPALRADLLKSTTSVNESSSSKPSANTQEGQQVESGPIRASRTDVTKSAEALATGARTPQEQQGGIEPENVPLPASRADLAKSTTGLSVGEAEAHQAEPSKTESVHASQVLNTQDQHDQQTEATKAPAINASQALAPSGHAGEILKDQQPSEPSTQDLTQSTQVTVHAEIVDPATAPLPASRDELSSTHAEQDINLGSSVVRLAVDEQSVTPTPQAEQQQAVLTNAQEISPDATAVTASITVITDPQQQDDTQLKRVPTPPTSHPPGQSTSGNIFTRRLHKTSSSDKALSKSTGGGKYTSTPALSGGATGAKPEKQQLGGKNKSQPIETDDGRPHGSRRTLIQLLKGEPKHKSTGDTGPRQVPPAGSVSENAIDTLRQKSMVDVEEKPLGSGHFILSSKQDVPRELEKGVTQNIFEEKPAAAAVPGREKSASTTPRTLSRQGSKAGSINELKRSGSAVQAY
ncbi:hypothetical protein HDU85_004817 [Gaertneriomyces sp. JEL0708]|nr:hypothetical protein HDU85_004817 [Gaertneriomyces sp. JEL0708]